MADIVRAKGRQFLERFKAILSYQQLKAFRAVLRCRTAALGGHKDRCVGCAYEPPISFNSCRSRCCPKCQAHARRRWLEAQQRDLLNTNYFHVVFTLPHELNPLALTTPRRFFDLLFEASSQTLLEVAADPRRLGAEIGFLSILHTWSSNLLAHYHIHCVVPAGGLSADHGRWIHTSHPLFLLPIPTLRTVFRDKFLDGLRQLYRKDMLHCRGPAADFRDQDWFVELTARLGKKNWFVYAKPPFGGPAHVLRYLGRYTHRMAISNHRLTAFDGEQVSFRWRDYAHGSKQRVMTLDAVEFLRRFSCTFCPRVSYASATTACCRTASANNCCPWPALCSPPKAANRFRPRPCRTANPGTVPVAVKPCMSSSASPRHNSIWQPSIPHDRLRQSGRPACSTHAFTEVCPYHPATLQNLLHRRPETTR